MRWCLWTILATMACHRPAPPAPASQPVDPRWLTRIDLADGRGDAQLLKGFYGLEGGKWRWSAPTFAVALAPPHPVLTLRFSLPQAATTQLQSVTLSATLNGVTLQPEKYDHAGDFVYRRVVDPQLLTGPIHVEFALDKRYQPGGADTRSLGLIVHAVGFELQ